LKGAKLLFKDIIKLILKIRTVKRQLSKLLQSYLKGKSTMFMLSISFFKNG